MLSVAEVVREALLARLGPDSVPGGIIVGPAPYANLTKGCIVIADLGTPAPELYTPAVKRRLSLRCEAGSIAEAETLSTKVEELLRAPRRQVVRQPSDGSRYVLYDLRIVSGPILTQGDTEDTWAEVLQAEAFVGTLEV